jgi:glycosyltransferase involved in cell wall biosynthesis
LAGPCRNAEAENLINRALQEHKGFINYVGAVYGDRKVEYFRSIDCFLFPTRFHTESWGIVLNEALASGVPVITTNRGCIQTLVGNSGLVVEDATQYVDQAVRQVKAWMDSQEKYAAASRAAVDQADFLHREGELQLEQFKARICSPVRSTTVENGNGDAT